MTSRPRASARSMHVGPDAVGADDDRGAVVDVVERLDRPDAQVAGGRGRRPRCGRPGRGCASACRPRPTPWPCRSPRERRSRSRCASRCGRPATVPMRPIIARGPRSAAPRTDAPLGAAAAAAAMRRMIRSVASGLGRLAVESGGQLVGRAGTARPTRIVTWPPGCGSFWPLGQTRSCRRSRSGTIGAPVRRASIARPSLPAGARRRAARALREDHQDVALVEDPLGQPERVHVGGAAVDRMDAAVAGHPADDRPVEHLLLAEPVDPPAERRHQPRRRG